MWEWRRKDKSGGRKRLGKAQKKKNAEKRKNEQELTESKTPSTSERRRGAFRKIARRLHDTSL